MFVGLDPLYWAIVAPFFFLLFFPAPEFFCFSSRLSAFSRQSRWRSLQRRMRLCAVVMATRLAAILRARHPVNADPAMIHSRPPCVGTNLVPTRTCSGRMRALARSRSL